MVIRFCKVLGCSTYLLYKTISRLCKTNSNKSTKFGSSTIVTFHISLVSELCQYLPLKRIDSKYFDYDYNVLLLKRPLKSNNFANRIVFPGGVLNENDLTKSSWSNIIDIDKFNKLLQTSVKSSIYTEIKKKFPNCHYQKVDPIIGLRLCAIRELFEETGLLLIQDPQANSPYHASVYIPDSKQLNELLFYLSTGHDEALGKIFSDLGYKPPILALHEWSNWLSPTGSPTIYNTMFFFVKIVNILSSSSGYYQEDRKSWQSLETETLYSDTPAAFLYPSNITKSNCELKRFAPPQAYELGRLTQFNYLENLSNFAAARSILGSRQWCPLIINAMINSKSCRVYFLPGDERYNEVSKLSLKSSNFIDLHKWELDKERNRFIQLPDVHEFWFDSTVHELGHVPPITLSEYLTKFNCA